MKRFFAIILLILIFCTATPVQAKHGHTPHRYAQHGRNYKHAGNLPRQSHNIYYTQYKTPMTPNYKTNTHANYKTATVPNYKNQMTPSYRNQIVANYRTQITPNYRTQMVSRYNY